MNTAESFWFYVENEAKSDLVPKVHPAWERSLAKLGFAAYSLAGVVTDSI